MYKILPHRVGLKIQVQGKTKEEMFSEALRGMFDIIIPKFKPEQKAERKIEIKSNNIENLLIEFLNEALYLSDINNEMYIVADFKKLTDMEIKAVIFGQKIEGFKKEIKAATHHGLKIKEDNEGWKAIIVFGA